MCIFSFSLRAIGFFVSGDFSVIRHDKESVIIKKHLFSDFLIPFSALSIAFASAVNMEAVEGI